MCPSKTTSAYWFESDQHYEQHREAFNQSYGGARSALASERAFTASIREGEVVSSRMADAPTEEKIDESTGKFLRPRSDIAHFEMLAYLSRANCISTAGSRQSANLDRGGNGRPAEPARASGVSERDCSH
jgi:hypothetical protein